jgi:hypothetical protein
VLGISKAAAIPLQSAIGLPENGAAAMTTLAIAADHLKIAHTM